MVTMPVKAFGSGRNTRDNPSLLAPGEARDALNLIFGNGPNHCALRGAIGRVNATRAANARALMIADLVKTDLSRIKLQKVGAALYTFTNTFASTPSSILSSMDATHLPGYTTANGLMFIADWQAKNYSTDGTSAGSHELQLAAQSSAWITLASAGAAVGNAAGTVYYAFTRVQAYDGAEHAPSAALAVTRTADQGVTVTNAALVFTTPWTTVRLYRTKAGGTQFYLVASGLTSGSFPYADTSLDTSLTTASEVHGDDVLTASIEKPAAAKHCCFHRGRLFLANFSGLGSRLRWSRQDEPTQFENSEDAYQDVGLNDGQEITGIVSFRGSLVIFKTYSIWVLNGDVDETNFVFAPVVQGIGCVAPRTIAVDGDRFVYFLSHQGVYRFDLGQLPEAALSDKIAPDLVGLAFTDRADYFCGGIDPRTRVYQVSVSPSGATTNTKTHTFSIESGAWGRYSYAMGAITPSCYSSTTVAPVVDSNGEIRGYVGDESGYFYQLEAAASGADGEPTGDVFGTVTSATATTTTCSAAAFMTTGNGLLGLSMTVRRAADASYETVTITSNTATALTHAALSGTAITAGDTVFIGAIQATISFGRFTGGTDARKRFVALYLGIEKQTTTHPLRAGYRLDGDASATTREYTMSDYKVRTTLSHRRGTGLSPYLDWIGVDGGLEVLSMEMEFEWLGNRRRPTR